MRRTLMEVLRRTQKFVGSKSIDIKVVCDTSKEPWQPAKRRNIQKQKDMINIQSFVPRQKQPDQP